MTADPNVLWCTEAQIFEVVSNVTAEKPCWLLAMKEWTLFEVLNIDNCGKYGIKIPVPFHCFLIVSTMYLS